MSDEEKDNLLDNPSEQETDHIESHSSYKLPEGDKADLKFQLTGMYQDWFLDYASYVILQRAVPHIEDGLKPVQRRILHVMKRMEDGRNNKVASIVGETMKFHPHGDASIYETLVKLGQKELLIDCQGNWGNIFTDKPTAMPSTPCASNNGNFVGRVIGSLLRPSYEGRHSVILGL